jgi:hypothetical protein
MAKPQLKALGCESTRFRVFGPFEVHSKKGARGPCLCPATTAEKLQQEIADRYPNENLLTKRGCYIFAIRTAGRGKLGGVYKPWYVGEAQKQPVVKEALNSDNFIKKYSKAFQKYQRGTPVLFFIAKQDPGMKVSINKRTVASMQTALIWHAADANGELLNIKENPSLVDFEIAGVPLVGHHHTAKVAKGPARDVAKMLGL